MHVVMSAHFLIVFLGAGLGGAMRHGVNLVAAHHLGTHFPFGTLAVNVLGSFAMGLLVGLLALRFSASQEVRLFLATGMLGGFTTFSAFSLDAALMWERGALWLTGLYIVLSVSGALLGIAAGLWTARQFG